MNRLVHHRGVRYGLAFLLMLGLVGLYMQGRDLRNSYSNYRANQERVKALQAEAEQLKQDKERLEERVSHLSSDPVEKEEAIRRNKDLVREGETVYRVDVDPR